MKHNTCYVSGKKKTVCKYNIQGVTRKVLHNSIGKQMIIITPTMRASGKIKDITNFGLRLENVITRGVNFRNIKLDTYYPELNVFLDSMEENYHTKNIQIAIY